MPCCLPSAKREIITTLLPLAAQLKGAHTNFTVLNDLFSVIVIGFFGLSALRS